NVHFHSLVLDGVYEAGADGAVRFRPLPPAEDEEVARVARRVARRLARLLERRGLGPDADPSETDPLPTEEPLLATLYAASVAGRVATGPRAGRRVLRLGDRVDAEDLPLVEGERCTTAGGVSLHANVAVPAHDRRRLERLCRYVARPPVATERLSRMEDGRLLYRLKHRWRDGTTHVVFEPLELLERLAALVPPPRFHLVRYHGILGPCASARDRVVPGDPEAVPRARAALGSSRRGDASAECPAGGAEAPSRLPAEGRPDLDSEEVPSEDSWRVEEATPRRRSLSWAELMHRVFAIDVLACPRCGGRLRVLAAIHPPETSRAILECLELHSRAPPTEPARHEEVALPGGLAGDYFA
ncbi:MAG: transposase, partial [Candidatus Rokubacteria bacterium]|nr:transposase [Candidatus Rokubacteria bacterium]